MRFRYSLRFVLVLIACVAVCLAYETYLAKVHRDAMSVIRAVEGNVSPPETIAPDWLVDLIGAEYFCHIERVDGLYRKMTDDHLATLSRVPELKSIATNFEWAGSTIAQFSLANSGRMNESPMVSDVGLTQIAKLANLETLVLFNTKVTDKGIAELQGMRRLENLMISSQDITDDAIPHLSRIKSLRHLWIAGTSISAAGLAELRSNLPECEVISDNESNGPYYRI